MNGINRTGSLLHDPATGRVIIVEGLIDGVGGVEYGALSAIIVKDYIGDDTNGRIIDLGDDYDEIEIITRDPHTFSDFHLVLARAIQNAYSAAVARNGAGDDVIHYSMANANIYFQGKLTGEYRNNITLGSTGNAVQGTNSTGKLYRILGKKYHGVRS